MIRATVRKRRSLVDYAGKIPLVKSWFLAASPSLKSLLLMRVLSGIQPTGRFHWGNFFGAIRQYIDLQDDNDGFYFIADLHALTTVRDPAVLRQHVLDAAIDLLALGLDPDKATLFIQSHVPEVSELCWILMTAAPMGLLERCHAYKEKKADPVPVLVPTCDAPGSSGRGPASTRTGACWPAAPTC